MAKKPKTLEELWQPIDGSTVLASAVENALQNSDITLFARHSIYNNIVNTISRLGAKLVDKRAIVIDPNLAYRLMRVCSNDGIMIDYRLNALVDLRKEMEKVINDVS